MIIATDPTPWSATLDRPPHQRHGAAPRALLEQLEKVNGHAATAAQVSQDFIDDVEMALAELPAIVLARLKDNFLGVFFAHGVGSSGVTDIVMGPDGAFHGIAIALDVDAFIGRSANEWISWRENTPFQPSPFRVAVRIAEPADDVRKNAIQFFLLHEIGHVLAAGRGFVPDWWLMPAELGRSEDYSFLPLSWQLGAGGELSPLARNDFARRDQLSYYGRPRIAGADMVEAYRCLLGTDFFTMYAALSADEDFSESFALYVHTELLQKPYLVRIYEDSRLLLQYASHWGEQRFAAKLALLRRFLPASADGARAAAPGNTAPAQPLPDYVVAAMQPQAPLIGVAPLMRRAFRHEDMVPIATALVGRANDHPLDACAYLDCSTVLQLTGKRELGLALQAEAVQLRRHYTLPARGAGPGLRLLVVMGLGDLMSNTPIEFLVEDSDVTLELLYVTADALWPEQLPEHDLMMVCLAESDGNQPLLQRLAALLADWPRPVLNRPERIAVLSRDGVCAALAAIDGLEMPRTARLDRARLLELAAAPELLAEPLPDAAFPLIVRPIGSHAGHDLEKVDTPAALAAYLERVAAERFYLSRFVDYRGADGLFRKFRVVLIDGVPFVCHYAISSHWMIHYLNADMDKSAAKRAEEARCMAEFDTGFALRHRAALAEINRRIGLPYLGIDCAETPDGKLLIFEIDNAMIVHAMDDEQMYPYKKPAMQKIFTAFRRLLDRQRLAPPLTVMR